MFFKAFKDALGDESKIKTFYGTLQIPFFAQVGPQRQRHLAAKCTRVGKGHANEGWQINPEMVTQVCTNFNEPLLQF